MNDALRGVECCFSFIDNLQIASKSHADLVCHLREVYEQLRQYSYELLHKICFWKIEGTFFCNKVAATDILPLPGMLL